MTQSVFWGCHKMCYYNAAMTLNARNCHNVVYFKHYICIISSNKFMFLSRSKRRRNIKVAAEKSKKYSNPFYCCFSGDKFWSACRNLFIVRLRDEVCIFCIFSFSCTHISCFKFTTKLVCTQFQIQICTYKKYKYTN